ncbi:copper amine oxidase N-terminal domain-containing protein [Cohnella zeiphila]|uniref:Copper amine oxidase-like N-terminal domain-containing protein n=1 Tax=Cohnella zeiphila TaxID=2761120 RepID=A0A7X0SJV4_9BACL|nr:copper amine oxidase N-terminal domain-containing protein [Cohnella zeiphila]MBB6730154.1 hypothetical protein [Cohnella zeiphila]
MKKGFITAMACAALLTASIAPGAASAASGGAYIYVDGVPLHSKAVTKNGGSFVPFRELFEQLGMGIGYDPKLQQVTGTKDDLKITFTIGSKTAYVNGRKKVLQAAPFTQSGTTYIPLRIVGEATGNSVNWSSQANLITVSSPDFKIAAYTVDGVTVVVQSNGALLVGPAADEALANERELAEEKAIREFQSEYGVISSSDKPTEEQSKDPGYKGYPDYWDENYAAAAKANEPLPPLMSEGWISLAMLSKIENVNRIGNTDPNTVTIAKYIGIELVRLDIVLTDEYKKATNGDFVLGDVHVKKYKGMMYLSIEDLKTSGLIE